MTQKDYSEKKTKIIWKGFIIRLVIIFFVTILSYASYFGYKFYRLEKKVVVENIEIDQNDKQNQSTLIQVTKDIITKNYKPLRGEEKERINILLLGMGGEGHKGKYLTDTIILVSINPKTYQSAFLSIPRDLYVNVADTGIYTKINAVYSYSRSITEDNSAQAFNQLKKTIKNITDQEVDYYIALDFDGFKKIIDELGGINIEVKEDIYDSRYPGPNYSYETFEIKKGQHYLNGETALKYSRVRHIAGGDFGRAERQQQVLAATKRKAFSISEFINPVHLSNIIDILGDHLQTDIHFDDIPAFINLVEKINIYQTTNKVLDAWSDDSLLASSHISLGGVMAYILIPKTKNYSQVQELIKNIFDLGLIERKKNSIKEEQAQIVVIAEEFKDSNKIKNIFSQWGYNVETKYEKEWAEKCQKQNIIFNYNQNNAKIFTLDDLGDKLEAEITEEKIGDSEKDIVICLNNETVNYYNQQNFNKEEELEDLKNKSVINNVGDVLINQKEQE